MAEILARSTVVQHRQPVSYSDHRRHADGAFHLFCIVAVDHDRLIFFVPVIQIFGPVHPDRIGVFAMRRIDPDVVGEQEPSSIAFFIYYKKARAKVVFCLF